ncbi:MAG: hemerythrin domain-containing protein [Candidatus Brocadia sp.]|nr:hemerythrin domain-containing protein [Candidatus Brocadia sp.]
MKRFFIAIVAASFAGTSACAPPKYRIYQEHKHTETANPSVTDILHYDFDVIKRVLQILEKASYCLDEDKPVSKETFHDIVEVISGFSDKHHQEKEDKVLFPALKVKNEGEKKDFLGRLLMEHVSARDEIRNLDKALINFYQGKKAKKKITKIARSYIKHMEKHIEMEEKILFPWINKVLSPDEQVIFMKKFEALEQEDLEAGVHEKYSAMIERLEQQLELCSKREG